MIRLRPYKLSDAGYVLNWFNDEFTFSQWCAGKFSYPLTKGQLDEYYHSYENDDNAWIFTALNEEGIPVGHFFMCKADYKNESVHLGFIVADPKIRGQGYGKEMVALSVRYAFDILKVKRVTLKVFDNNPTAYYCYKSVGFVDEKLIEGYFTYGNDKWAVYDMAIVK